MPWATVLAFGSLLPSEACRPCAPVAENRVHTGDRHHHSGDSRDDADPIGRATTVFREAEHEHRNDYDTHSGGDLRQPEIPPLLSPDPPCRFLRVADHGL